MKKSMNVLVALGLSVVFGAQVGEAKKPKPLPSLEISPRKSFAPNNGWGFDLDLVGADSFFTSSFDPSGAVRFGPISQNGLHITIQSPRGTRPTFTCKVSGDNLSPVDISTTLTVPGETLSKPSPYGTVKGDAEIVSVGNRLSDGSGRVDFILNSTNNSSWRFFYCKVSHSRT